MQPQDVDYINVHGTSTPLGDVARRICLDKANASASTFKVCSCLTNLKKLSS
ncbi:hypothetical protein N9Y89_02110 [bacterium]|nr:hypothetical protein [bacterium]